MSDFFVSVTPQEAKQRPHLRLSADEADRADVAARFGLIGIARLDAELAIAVSGDVLHVTGTIDAAVTQRCVATGDPVPARLREPVDVRFVPNVRLEAATPEAEVELGGDEMEVIGYDGGRAAIGEMVAETLSLALGPYPRSAGADAWLAEKGVKNEEEAGAFGALAALRDQLKKG
jgi:uncharacterized metal-binding protein YceD (DUF177 family)